MKKKPMWIYVIVIFSLLLIAYASISILSKNSLTGAATWPLRQESTRVLTPDIEKCYYCINASGDVTSGLVTDIKDCPGDSFAKEIKTTKEQCQKAWATYLQYLKDEKISEEKTMNQLETLGAKIDDVGGDERIGPKDSFEIISQEPETKQKVDIIIINFNERGLSFPSDANLKYSGSSKVLQFAMNKYSNTIPSETPSENFIIGYGFQAFPLKKGDSLTVYLDDSGSVKDYRLYTANSYSQSYDYGQFYDRNKMAMVSNPFDVYTGAPIQTLKDSLGNNIARTLNFQFFYNLFRKQSPFY
ncbi:MAG: hypothetical protein KKE23_02575 [Nanoarchaeota archaeon]|nr:hypothetical protein [Nanoarchaeota archaeon]